MYDNKTLERMAERLLRRIDTYWTKFEETGDAKYARIACEADRMYLRVKAVQ